VKDKETTIQCIILSVKLICTLI